jgi:dTDP-4-dehydrorhamnose 3,5-epimerase
VTRNHAAIAGVFTVELDVHGDERGRFSELFRTEWFPERAWDQIQVNRSHSGAGILRGLHFHRKQADYWHLVVGSLRVGLYDLRRQSPTRGTAEALQLDGDAFHCLFVPPGVAHGYYALTEATFLYVVDQYYTGGDEFGVAWDDPDLGLDWGIEPGTTPVVSERDASNPRLAEIDAGDLP